MTLEVLINWHKENNWKVKMEDNKSICFFLGQKERLIEKENRERANFFLSHARAENWKAMAEIGVAPGGTAQGILPHASSMVYIMVERQPELSLYGLILRSDRYDRQEGRNRRPIVLMRMCSNEAPQFIADKSLDAVFIDAQHAYESVLEDIRLWLPKVRQGGIISGHDFNPWGVKNRSGVDRAVTESFDKINLFLESSGNCVWWRKV